MKMPNKIILLLLCVLSFAPAASTRKASIRDKEGLFEAMSVGDQEKVENLRATGSPPLRVVAEAVAPRMRFDLDKSDKKVADCLRYAEVDNRAPTVAFICHALKAGNSFLRGDISAWAVQLKELRKDSEANGLDGLLDAINDVPDYTQWTKIAVHDHLSIGARPILISFKHTAKHENFTADGGIFFDARVNGRAILLGFDTGAIISLLDKGDANKAGMELTRNWLQDGGLQITAGRFSLGTARDMSFGDVVLKNWPVSVGDRAGLGVLGLEAISRMGPLLLSYDGVHLLSEIQSTALACQRDIDVSSGLTGLPARLRFPVIIDGTAQFAVLDTGQTAALAKVDGTDAEMTNTTTMSVQRAGGLSIEETVGQRSVSLIAGPVHTTMVMTIYKDYKSDYSYALGADFLKYADIFLDFSSRKACILPKNTKLVQ
ncbi:retropepsin-like aspartic protease [Dyella flagellata]|uniref:Aspartyl protease n=1 Tax=Dyella flagellata TaxID=1867833 RepID=A0ABQ5XHT0_9GAMM|nr:retropepsin-like aspartic protease [Dyella flagellata]GLQ90912.1 hypothetical protein GCM10007898_44880 [Dyella flagellata]